ncbi:MAG: DUF975 family protein [Treponemataceae bacterium]|nr:MAG: DUF975 family protein [Treponemataceae bacterium]
MFTIGALKNDAKQSLRKNLKYPVLITLISLGIAMLLNGPEFFDNAKTVPNFFKSLTLNDFDFFYADHLGFTKTRSLLLGFLTILVNAALQIGVCKFYLAFVLNPDQTNFNDFLEGLTLWHRGLLGSLWKMLFLFLWGMLAALSVSFLIVIGIIVFAVFGVLSFSLPAFDVASYPALAAVFGAMIVAVGVFWINRYIAYSQMLFILAESPGMTVQKAMRASIAMTRGFRLNIFLLYASFLPWILLCVCTFGIALLYVQPYMHATGTNTFKFLKANALNSGIFVKRT